MSNKKGNIWCLFHEIAADKYTQNENFLLNKNVSIILEHDFILVDNEMKTSKALLHERLFIFCLKTFCMTLLKKMTLLERERE